NAQAWLLVERNAPEFLIDRARTGVGDVPVSRELMREGAHVASALHIVLTAQGIDADAIPAKVSGRHREIGDREHRGRTLAVLGDAEPVIDCRIAAGG